MASNLSHSPSFQMYTTGDKEIACDEALFAYIKVPQKWFHKL